MAKLLRILRRAACFFRGHDWAVHRIQPLRSLWLMHLNTLAACDASCARCGEEWRDADAHGANWPPAINCKPHHWRTGRIEAIDGVRPPEKE